MQQQPSSPTDAKPTPGKGGLPEPAWGTPRQQEAADVHTNIQSGNSDEPETVGLTPPPTAVEPVGLIPDVPPRVQAPDIEESAEQEVANSASQGASGPAQLLDDASLRKEAFDDDAEEDDELDSEEDSFDVANLHIEMDSPNKIRKPIKQKQNETATSEDTKQTGGAVKHKGSSRSQEDKPRSNLVIKLLEKNPLGMTLPEMAGGTRKMKRIKTLRPMLAQAIKEGLIMPVSQRAGHTVYRLVRHIGSR